jgi:hypothetical protein
MIQNATPNRMPPAGLLNVKVYDMAVARKEGDGLSSVLNTLGNKVTTWLGKCDKGMVTIIQYFTFPNDFPK